MINFDDIVENKNNDEPKCDVVECGSCKKIFNISECIEVEDGDWETGFYIAHDCPVCEDGGEPEYAMSKEQADKWERWSLERKKDI